MATQYKAYSYLTVNSEAPNGFSYDEYDDVPRENIPLHSSPFSLNDAMVFAHVTPITHPIIYPTGAPIIKNEDRGNINNLINRRLPFDVIASSNPIEDAMIAIEIIHGRRKLDPRLIHLIRSIAQRNDEMGSKAKAYLEGLESEVIKYRTNYAELDAFLKQPGEMTDEIQKQMMNVCLDQQHPIFKEAKRFAFMSVLRNQYTQNYQELNPLNNKQTELKYWIDALTEMNNLSQVKVSITKIEKIANYINQTFTLEKDWDVNKDGILSHGATFAKMYARNSLINQKLTANIFFLWDEAGKLHFYFNDIHFFRYKSKILPIEELGRFHELIDDKGFQRSYDDVFAGKQYYLFRKTTNFKNYTSSLQKVFFRPFAELNFVRYESEKTRKFGFPPSSENLTVDAPSLKAHLNNYFISPTSAPKPASPLRIIKKNPPEDGNIQSGYKLPDPPNDPLWLHLHKQSQKTFWQLLEEAINGQITAFHKSTLQQALEDCKKNLIDREICKQIESRLSSNRYHDLRFFDVDPFGFIQWWKSLSFIMRSDGNPMKNPFTLEEISKIYHQAKHEFDEAIKKDPMAKSFEPHMIQHMENVEEHRELIQTLGIDYKYYHLLVFLHDAGKYIPSQRVLGLATQTFSDSKKQTLYGRVVWHDQSTAEYLINLGERVGIHPSKIEHLIKDIVGHNDGSQLPNIFWNDMFPGYPLPLRVEGFLLALFDRMGQGDWTGAAKILPQTRSESFFDKVKDAYFDSPQNTIHQLEVIHRNLLLLLQNQTHDKDAAILLQNTFEEAVRMQQTTIDGYSRLKWTNDKKICAIKHKNVTYIATNVEEFLLPKFQQALKGVGLDYNLNPTSTSLPTPLISKGLLNYPGDVKNIDLDLPFFLNQGLPFDIMGMTSHYVGDPQNDGPERSKDDHSYNPKPSIDIEAMSMVTSGMFPLSGTTEHRQKICIWYSNSSTLDPEFKKSLEKFIQNNPQFCAGFTTPSRSGSNGTDDPPTTIEDDESSSPQHQIWWKTIHQKLGGDYIFKVQQMLLGSKIEELKKTDPLYVCAIYGSNSGINKLAKQFIDSQGGYTNFCKKRLDQFIAHVPTGEQNSFHSDLISNIRYSKLRFLNARQFQHLINYSQDKSWLAAFVESWLLQLQDFTETALGIQGHYNMFTLNRDLSKIKDPRLVRNLWDIQIINEYSPE
ncbi:MAG: hypothetical protein IT286_00690, partial [Proteobacteria bacterium]|nr:hypothetical protein [Pseudomonadota bacterium]